MQHRQLYGKRIAFEPPRNYFADTTGSRTVGVLTCGWCTRLNGVGVCLTRAPARAIASGLLRRHYPSKRSDGDNRVRMPPRRTPSRFAFEGRRSGQVPWAESAPGQASNGRLPTVLRWQRASRPVRHRVEPCDHPLDNEKGLGTWSLAMMSVVCVLSVGCSLVASRKTFEKKNASQYAQAAQQSRVADLACSLRSACSAQMGDT